MQKVDMIVDLQYGSTGKGLIAGYLAVIGEPDTIINANMPNAGHTYIDQKGNKMVFKVLPNGIVSPKCKNVMLGAGSVFSLDRLIEEIKVAVGFGYLKGVTIHIHNNAVMLKDEHKQQEDKLSSIGSTQQGSSAAVISKINRPTDKYVIVRDTLLSLTVDGVFIKYTTSTQWRDLIKAAKYIIAEGAQGFSLGIDEKFYPYCTSRNCTPARFMSDMGIPLSMLRAVIGTVRTYPIRVGGSSGGYYEDQVETSWEELDLEKEFTTVTGRERRVFTFSERQVHDAIWACEPTVIFLNFCNYLGEGEKLDKIRSSLKGIPTIEGWGATHDDIKQIR